jgi:hypothetical protein
MVDVVRASSASDTFPDRRANKEILRCSTISLVGMQMKQIADEFQMMFTRDMVWAALLGSRRRCQNPASWHHVSTNASN